MESTLPLRQGEAETLEISLSHLDALELTLYYTAYEDVLCRRAVLKNASQREYELGKLMSFMLDIPGKYELVGFDGAWIAEAHKSVTPLGRARIVRDSVTGASSNRHQPGFLLAAPFATEEHGEVYGFNLIYSGNHYASVQRSHQGLNRIMQGINFANFKMPLAPKAEFETPAAVLFF